ncbi:hypothetical protein CCHR01_10207 [Colletotrichum chrysophilum]|uniref:Ubiquitin-like domain-containing protein n=1 Tax=Colletotrichum chrysophilum TaxID=1836956 RepID=A0AAD9AFD1_9PEZI|nr:hypothetical protein CCHR01_10207 [Colletotrichum chrysophilum]
MATSTTTAILLRVKTGDGQPAEVEIESRATIAALKQKISEITKIPPTGQKLRADGFEFKDNDDKRIVGDVLKSRATLHFINEKPQPQVQAGGGKATKQGHEYKGTRAKNSVVQQGTKVETGFQGQDPSNRGKHGFHQTNSSNGQLVQGDQLKAPQTPGSPQASGSSQASNRGGRGGRGSRGGRGGRGNTSQSSRGRARGKGPSHQGGTYSQGQRPKGNAPPARNKGNTYVKTTTDGTVHHQGDVIHSNFAGLAPEGLGEDSFEDTECDGGSLHQGNMYGSDSTKK